MSHQTWGGRFKKEMDSMVRVFNASLSFDYVLYPYDIMGSQVHARMLARQELILDHEAKAICTALEEIGLEIENEVHPLDASCEDIHMFIEQLLILKIGDIGKKLHTGRSRNDQVALDLRLYARDAGKKIIEKLDALILTLSQLGARHIHDQMPGYTHLQQAQPIALGHYFQAYESMFQRDHARMNDWLKRMNYSPLGAGALVGSQLPLDRAWVAHELGFIGIIENTLDAVSDRDFVIELCSIVSMMMMHLSRMSEDLILWATSEFNFITLDDAFSTGSSLMPNKKNPDVLELIRGKSGRVFGHLMGMLTVMKSLPLAYNKDMQEDKEHVFDTIHTAFACLDIMPPFLNSIEWNTEWMQKKATSGYLDATAILESLVLKGMPFRDAHHQVGEWVATAIQNHCSLAEVMKQEEPLSYSKPIHHLLTGLEWTPEEALDLLHLARTIKQHPAQYTQHLKGKSLVMVFEKPSFRTRLSFALAMQQMGGYVVESINQSRKSEEPRDMMRVLNGYADIVMVRTHGDDLLEEMAQYATIPIINGLSALHHPCQVLADLLTLQEHFGTLKGLTVAYIGDGNNVLHSLLLLAPPLGIQIHYCCPEHHQPNADVLAQSRSNANPGMTQCFSKAEDAACDAHALYTDVWTSMGFKSQSDDHFEGLQVNERLMSYAKSDAVFMHCMPMERGKEVSSTLPDRPESMIFTQSENRLHIQKAILSRLLGPANENNLPNT